MTSSTQLPTKLCHITKRPDFEGYGFNLHSEKVKPGQYIGKVDINSPAEASGLKEGDRIIAVNGVNINQESHKQVVQRIKALSDEVRLLIVDTKVIKSEKGVTKSTFPANFISESSKEKSAKKEFEGNIQETPGSSTNINSMSINAKRSFNHEHNIVNAYKNEHNGSTTIDANEILLRDQSNQNFTSSSSHSAITTRVQNTPTPSDSIGAERSLNGVAKTASGGLELPITAAEMRAKLLSKKKYDPKNEIVDLKKKFEIIQKL